MKYIVELKYTNPGHEHVSLRRRVDTVSRVVEASNEDEALNRAANQQRALGFKIQEAKIVKPEVASAPEVLAEGFDTDPKDIAAYLVDRHGKGKVTMDHIEAYERRRDSHRPIEKHEVMKFVKQMSEEVEQIDEMDKSQPSSSRGAEGLATGNKATPVTSKKTAADALKILKKKVNPVKEEVEAVEEGADDWKKAFKRVAAKNYEKDVAAVRSSAHRLDKATRGFPAKPDTKPTDSNIDYIKQKVRRGVTKPHSMQEEVDADKRDAGYKMSPTVRAAQKKSDELSKVVKRPQAGTLAAAKMKKEAADPGSVKVVNKKITAADKMISAAKKAATVNLEPELKITRPMV